MEDGKLRLLTYLYVNDGCNLSMKQCASELSCSEKTVRTTLSENEITKDTPFKVENLEDCLRMFERNYSSRKLPVSSGRVELITNSDEDSENCLLICIADLHIGAYEAREGITYNFDIVSQRVSKSIEKIHKIIWNENPDKVYIMIMGDIFESVLGNMRPGQKLDSRLYGKAQIDFTRQVLLRYIREISEVFSGQIAIMSVSGNHDRITQSVSDDFDRVVFETTMESVYTEARGIRENISFVENVGRINTFQATKSIRVIAHHGDQGVDAKSADLCIMDSINPARYRVVVTAHKHRRMFSEYTNYCHVQVPSLMGPSQYSVDQLIAQCLPGIAVICLKDEKDENPEVFPYFLTV